MQEGQKRYSETDQSSFNKAKRSELLTTEAMGILAVILSGKPWKVTFSKIMDKPFSTINISGCGTSIRVHAAVDEYYYLRVHKPNGFVYYRCDARDGLEECLCDVYAAKA